MIRQGKSDNADGSEDPLAVSLQGKSDNADGSEDPLPE